MYVYPTYAHLGLILTCFHRSGGKLQCNIISVAMSIKSRVIIKDNEKGNQYPKFVKSPLKNRMFPNFAKFIECQN